MFEFVHCYLQIYRHFHHNSVQALLVACLSCYNKRYLGTLPGLSHTCALEASRNAPMTNLLDSTLNDSDETVFKETSFMEYTSRFNITLYLKAVTLVPALRRVAMETEGAIDTGGGSFVEEKLACEDW